MNKSTDCWQTLLKALLVTVASAAIAAAAAAAATVTAICRNGECYFKSRNKQERRLPLSRPPP
jgi:hypothetical protein